MSKISTIQQSTLKAKASHQNANLTRTGYQKRILALIESVERGRSQKKLTTDEDRFRRSPAPSPASQEERKKFEKEMKAMSKSKFRSQQ